MPDFVPEPNPPVPLIRVKSIYSPSDRNQLIIALKKRRAELEVGMPRFLADIVEVVRANNHRIQKIDGSFGLHVDQLSVRNMYHLLNDGKRSDDRRMQVLDAYICILREAIDPRDGLAA